MDNINETSLHGSLEDILNEPVLRSNHEFDECLETLNKPVEDRHSKEIEHLVSKIGSLGIFDRSLLENMDPKVVIKKLVPFFKYEFFPAGAPLFHYEQTADKMFIICRGKAREFDAKNLDTIEKESRAQYRADPLPREVAISLQELPNPKTLTSLNTLQEGQIQSLVIINEEDVKEIEREIRSPTTAAKKFQKMKAFFPFLKKMVAQKTATQRINDYSYKQSLRKARSLQRSNDHSSLLSPGTFENELIDSAILEEFKKFPRAYFIGGILKVKFSRYLESGDYCGLRALQDNALRTKAVIADEDCYCISLDKDDFFNVLEEEKALHLDKINFFKKLFGKFDEKRVIKFALGWDDQVLKIGDTVFQQNEPSDCLYALFRGEVVLSKAAPAQKKAQNGPELPFRIKRRQDPAGSMKVATLCAGDFFGDADFFQGNLREFTATVSSARAKILQLPLKKYQETQRNYFDFYREIKTIMGLKLKWNKERSQQQNQTQNSSLGRLSTLSPNFDKERVLKDIGHFFPASVNCIPNEEKPQTLNNLNNESSLHNNSIQNEIKSWICRDDRSNLGSPKSQSFFDFDNSSHKALLRVTSGNENSSRMMNKLVNVSKDRSLDTSGQDSILLFSRAQLPKQYTPRHGDLSRKSKEVVLETVPDVFEPKRIKIKRKTDVTSKADNVTRFSAIELLKKRAIKKKAQPVFMEMKAASQAIPSIEFDIKPQSPIFNETTNMTTTNQTNFSPGEKTQTLPSSLRGQSVENQHRKTKPISKGKLSRLLLETSDSSEPKRQFNSSGLCQNNSNHLANQKTVSNSTCFITGMFQTGPRYSMKSSQPDISKSLNNIQMLSPKGEDSQKQKENLNSKGFRVTTSKMNHEFFKITMGKKRPGTGIKRAALMQ